MPNLDIDERPFGAGEGRVLAHPGAAQPCAGGIRATFVTEDALEDKDFFPARMHVPVEPSVWRPAHQGGVYPVMRVQRHHRQAGNKPRQPRRGIRVYAHRRPVRIGELTEFYENQAAVA